MYGNGAVPSSVAAGATGAAAATGPGFILWAFLAGFALLMLAVGLWRAGRTFGPGE